MHLLFAVSQQEDAARHLILKILGYGLVAAFVIGGLFLVVSGIGAVGLIISQAFSRWEYPAIAGTATILVGLVVFAFGASVLAAAITALAVGIISLISLGFIAVDDDL